MPHCATEGRESCGYSLSAVDSRSCSRCVHQPHPRNRTRRRHQLENASWNSKTAGDDLNAYGDFGGGSGFTCQLLATAGVDFHRRFAISLGYRYLSVDYEKNTFLLDTALKGPIGGFTFKFQRED
jgi:hypothetical protein